MEEHQKPSLLDHLSNLLSREPETRVELVEVLRGAYERRLIGDDALTMIDGALQVSDINVSEIMIPRNQVSMVDLAADIDSILPELVEDGYSRYPVFSGNRDNIVGILLAKDLLKMTLGQPVSLRETLRPPVFIPESKRLNVLLQDFRTSRNHMAIVVDEYGSVAGVVTIEDVLEQIVGEIADEHDETESFEDWIVVCPDNRCRVAARIPVDEFDRAFDTHFADEPREESDDEDDSLSAYLTERFGHLPERGETITLDDLAFEVVRADPRRVVTVMVTRLGSTEGADTR